MALYDQQLLDVILPEKILLAGGDLLGNIRFLFCTWLYQLVDCIYCCTYQFSFTFHISYMHCTHLFSQLIKIERLGVHHKDNSLSILKFLMVLMYVA